jgi:thioredoxin reductase (NADPH)
MLVRGDSLSRTMSQYLIDQIEATDNIQIWTGAQVTEAIGSERLEKLVIARGGEPAVVTVPATALFIFIGARPHTDWIGDLVARDEHGFILSGPDVLTNGSVAPPYRAQNRSPFLLETSLPGVFAAGDVRRGSVKRVASAVGEGAMAVMYIHNYFSCV